MSNHPLRGGNDAEKERKQTAKGDRAGELPDRLIFAPFAPCNPKGDVS
jgi:hypothetical protein